MKRTRTHILKSSLALAAGIVALVAGVALPASSASAFQVDCSYIKGLGKYVDSYGVTCAGGTSSSTRDGSAMFPGGAAGAGGPCEFAEPEIPDYALEAFDRTTTRNSSVGKTRYAVTKYYDEKTGGLTKTKTQVTYESGDRETFFSDLNPRHLGFEIHSHWDCTEDNWEDPTFSTTFPDYTDTDGGHLTPGTPTDGSIPAGTTPRVIKSLASTSALTPIPGSSDLFLYRIDLVSKALNPLAHMAIDVGLQDFEVGRILTLPGGASCSAVYRTQECDLPALAPGATTTLVLQVKLRPTSTLATAGITSTASFKGVFPRAPRPVGAIFHLATRATAVPAPGAATPACDLGANVDGVPLTSEAVDTDTTTTLTTHCLNDLRQEMSARAEHGSVTIDGYGTMVYTPAPGFVGSDTVTVRASTSTEVGEPTRFAVTVVAAATAVDDRYSVTSGKVLEPAAGLLANDSVPVTQGWMIQRGETPPAHGTLELDARTGRFTYTPDEGFTGSDTFKYRLTGRSGASSQIATVTIDVTD